MAGASSAGSAECGQRGMHAAGAAILIGGQFLHFVVSGLYWVRPVEWSFRVRAAALTPEGVRAARVRG
ncbi:hypothetical protein GCM10011428_34960 [Streptomyces violaceus]